MKVLKGCGPGQDNFDDVQYTWYIALNDGELDLLDEIDN